MIDTFTRDQQLCKCEHPRRCHVAWNPRARFMGWAVTCMGGKHYPDDHDPCMCERFVVANVECES